MINDSTEQNVSKELALRIGKLMRHYRHERHLSLRELGERINSSATQINRYENGIRTMDSISFLVRFCSTLQIPIEEFLVLYDWDNQGSLIHRAFPTVTSPEIEDTISRLVNSITSHSEDLSNDDLNHICDLVDAYTDFCTKKANS